VDCTPHLRKFANMKIQVPHFGGVSGSRPMRAALFRLSTLPRALLLSGWAAPLAVSGLLPSSQPSVGSRNPPPLPSPLTLPQLRMLFQSTHEERQGAGASAEPGERTTKSPLQLTLTAQIMGLWAKHNGAVEHIGVKRSVEMLEMQRAQRLPACPPNPDTSVFAELFPAPQPAPSQPNARPEKA